MQVAISAIIHTNLGIYISDWNLHPRPTRYSNLNEYRNKAGREAYGKKHSLNILTL